MNDIMKILQALEDSDILLKEVTKAVKNGTKEHKGGFLGTLVDTSSVPRRFIFRKRNCRAGSGNKKGKGIVRAGSRKEWNF